MHVGASEHIGSKTYAGNPDTWSKVLATNLEAPMRLTRAFAPGMAEKKQGIIINISSIAGADQGYLRKPDDAY